MARRVLLHLGVPKSGTTFLQDVVWTNRQLLAERGLSYPGRRRGLHRGAARALQGLADVQQHAWPRLVSTVASLDGDVLVSHEAFSSAGAEHAARARADLAPAEVHLVVTARDLGAVVPSVWQQRLKRAVATPLADFVVPDDDGTMWSWRGLDPAEVLARWAEGLAPEHVHVVVAPRDGGADELWRRFAAACDVDPTGVDVEDVRTNRSLRAPAAELLRRVLAELGPDYAAADVSRDWVKARLAEGVLAVLPGPALHAPAAALLAVRARADRCVRRLREAGYHVVGDLDDLRPTDVPAVDTAPPSDAELLATATWAVVGLLEAWRAEHAAGTSRVPTRPDD